ncbi:MAG: glycosyltransferase family A protein [Zhengella sp.]|uniref:glycosyltransferase family 2 protein n=1 Tax=Zhengella sp. TaxID=2282762 RepID=UPI001D79C549|nr:glycosyltransferase family 2 protein [Notoacmeibacter sp.]
MPRPLCSVVIPAFNAMDFLPSAIASVEAQSISGLEVLVLDDGSTDGTAEWLRIVRAQRPWLKVFEGGDLGPARARNLLIEKANSGLIAFLDADDEWLPGKLARDIAYHEAQPDISFTFTDYLHLDPQGRSLGTAFEYWKPGFRNLREETFMPLENALVRLIGCNLVGTSTVVAKRERLRNANGFAEDLPSAEDWDLWLRLAQDGPVAVSTQVTANYLVRPHSETANRTARIAAMETILKRYGHSGGTRSARREARARLATVRAEAASIDGRHGDALAFRLGALLRQPSRRNVHEALAAVARLGGISGKAGAC